MRRFWHAFTGWLRELVDAQVQSFNDDTVNATHKGNHSEAPNAGIAAFRAGEEPHILTVFAVRTAR